MGCCCTLTLNSMGGGVGDSPLVAYASVPHALSHPLSPRSLLLLNSFMLRHGRIAISRHLMLCCSACFFSLFFLPSFLPFFLFSPRPEKRRKTLEEKLRGRHRTSRQVISRVAADRALRKARARDHLWPIVCDAETRAGEKAEADAGKAEAKAMAKEDVRAMRVKAEVTKAMAKAEKADRLARRLGHPGFV